MKCPDKTMVRILIADDQSEARNIIQSVLMSNGYFNVQFASDGNDAIDAVTSYKFDLIICDLNMPGAKGFDVAETLRKSRLNKKTPFLLLTSDPSRANVKKALESGVNTVLSKPFTASEIIETIEKILE